MECYQIATGDESLPSVIDRIAAEAAAVAPGLGRERARELADLIFRTRVTQTVKCGRADECEAVAGPLWGRYKPRHGAVRPACLIDADPYGLPRVFAAAAADLLDPTPSQRDCLEENLAAAFHAVITPLLFRNPSCGRASVCAAEFTDPFVRS